MLTKSERLINKVGHKITCEHCGKKKILDYRWNMTEDKRLACPSCVKALLGRPGILLLSL